MFRFYASLLSKVPQTLVGAAEVASAIVLLVFAVLAIVNRPIEKALALRWEGVSPWWAILPIAIVLAYMLAKANYDAFTEVGGIPDSRTTRQRFHTVFHSRGIPAFQAARELLIRFHKMGHLVRPTLSSELIRFAIIEPAESAFQMIYDALESPTHPIQFIGADFILAYRRMARSIELSLDLGRLQEIGITRGDAQVVAWQERDATFRTEMRALLNDPAFSTMRKIVREE